MPPSPEQRSPTIGSTEVREPDRDSLGRLCSTSGSPVAARLLAATGEGPVLPPGDGGGLTPSPTAWCEAFALPAQRCASLAEGPPGRRQPGQVALTLEPALQLLESSSGTPRASAPWTVPLASPPHVGRGPPPLPCPLHTSLPVCDPRLHTRPAPRQRGNLEGRGREGRGEPEPSALHPPVTLSEAIAPHARVLYSAMQSPGFQDLEPQVGGAALPTGETALLEPGQSRGPRWRGRPEKGSCFTPGV